MRFNPALTYYEAYNVKILYTGGMEVRTYKYISHGEHDI